MGKTQCETRDHIVMNKAKYSEIDERSLERKKCIITYE